MSVCSKLLTNNNTCPKKIYKEDFCEQHFVEFRSQQEKYDENGNKLNYCKQCKKDKIESEFISKLGKPTIRCKNCLQKARSCEEKRSTKNEV